MSGVASSPSGYQLPKYPFVVPPEIATGRTTRYPVVVVGAGLAGLTLACDLALRGIRAVVLDEDDTIGVRGASSRGIVYAQKTLEIFARLGIYERIRDKGVMWSRGKTLAGDTCVYEFDLSTATASLQPPFINLQQFYVESFLVDRIGEIGGTDLRWRNRVTKVEARATARTDGHDDPVVVSVETPAGAYRLEAEWLVDASGVHSLVRDGFDLDLHNADKTPDRWCITDVRFKKPLPVERWTWIEAPFNDGRAVWQHLMADDVWRMDFQMAPDADPESVSRPEVAIERIRRQIGHEVEFELVWVGPYSYRSHLLDRFRHGRVFFIGDSAHVMCPFGARGGNSGVQDADNLGWKLALALGGRAGDALLETYDHERQAAGAENVGITDCTARFLAPRSDYEFIQRRAVIELAREFPFARQMVNTGRLSTPTRYHDSPAVTSGGGSVQNVPITLRDGVRAGLVDLLRQLGTSFIGVWFVDDERAASAAVRVLNEVRLGLESMLPISLFLCGNSHPDCRSIVDPEGKLAEAAGAKGDAFALIRPDLHVAAVIDHPTPATIRAACQRARGDAA